VKQKTTGKHQVVGGSEQLSRIVGLFKYIATLQPNGWGLDRFTNKTPPQNNFPDDVKLFFCPYFYAAMQHLDKGF